MENMFALPSVTLGELAANLPVMAPLAPIVLAAKEGETEVDKQKRIGRLRTGLQFSAILLGCVPQLARERAVTIDSIYALPVSEGLQLLANSLSGVSALKVHALFQAAGQAAELGQAALATAASRGS